jgi:hypothetical protein
MAIRTTTGAQRYNARMERIFDDAKRRAAGLDVDYTAVVFKKFKDGDVIAFFPELPGDMSPGTCSSYQHVGQHGAASVDLLRDLRPATPAEYGPLKSELESAPYGYRFKVYKRAQRRFDKIRRDALAS